jgi:hypothetical protein
VERELTAGLVGALRTRLGADADEVIRQAAGSTLDDVVAQRTARVR